ncbi:hypothetical protein [Rhodococcus sp. BP-241]|uniref:hypothetical protein n=1 Tax=Rhodococcus sp. BP-241 TaxID=2739441 RepID=UPI0021C01C8E|nr:hypothetical protein [Rhodococcus sp. BP-241]
MTFSAHDVIAAARAIEKLVPSPWDRTAFLQALSEHRGRPIALVPIDAVTLQGLPCGLWLQFHDHDEIVCHADSSSYHVDQTIMHEVGHMVLGHGGSTAADTTLRELCPDIDLDALESVMKRSNFDDDQEGEAETFADLLMSAAVSRYRRSLAMHDFLGLT